LDIQSRALRHGLAYIVSQYTYRLSVSQTPGTGDWTGYGLSPGLCSNDFMQTAAALELMAVTEQQFALNTTRIFHYDNSNTAISISIQ